MDYTRSIVGPRLFSFLASTLLALPGCGLELDYTPPTDASGAAADTGGGMLDVGPPNDAGHDAGGVAVDASGDAFVTSDVGPVECAVDADCVALYGAPPCGAWQCAANACGVVCPNCTDDDLDGYGQGAGCAGADCDDTDDTVTDTSMRACAPSSGSSGVGACHDGTETCSAGTWGACLGAQGASAESCNGIDDDCDGTVDDGLGTVSCGLGACTATVPVCAGGALSICSPASTPTVLDGCGGGDDDCDGRIDENCTNCVWVATTGSDASPDPRVVATPFATVQHAIDFAAMDPTMPLRVCLLSNGCSATSAAFVGAVRMASGVHVQGNYAPGGAGLCTTTGVHTQIQTNDATGVLFDDAITRHTELSDVMVVPSSSATAAGVTVDGAHAAVLSDVWVVPQSAFVTNGYGVNVIHDGDALVQRSVIYGGHASAESIGIRVEGARATIENNCPGNLDAAGRCTVACSSSGQAGIRGRADTVPSRSAISYAILLRDASGSLVESSATCGQPSLDGAGIRIDGPADGVVVRGNFVPGWGPQNGSYGIDMADCGGASPLVTDNAEIDAEAPLTAPAVAIRSMGDCHPVIENNLRIVSGLEGSQTSIAILCGALGGVSSRCVVEGNPLVHAAIGGFPMTATGVRCEADACARIEQNEISGTQGATLVGLELGTAMALVARNRISGGCATASAIGIVATNSRARIENNLVVGGLACPSGSTGGARRYVALAASATDATYVVDVHGNDLDPMLQSPVGTTCASRGVELTGHPGVDVGLLRGNVLLAGTCTAAYPVFEVDVDSDPVSLEHNDLVPATGQPVYRDEGTSDVATAAAVDALGDTVLGGNLDTPAGFASYPADLHLAASSMCIDADFSPGAPLVDFDGRMRDATPDIGAFER